ncbi:hypothetical protein HanRHA438_Chr01g0031111 [Helianthus annuus]|nr:hypothetical protein HanRHA438_Chr01g0031111 [Helianthus annuus]
MNINGVRREDNEPCGSAGAPGAGYGANPGAKRPESSVLYYLCRNQQLEHPHFIEVTLVSPDGLYLRDVIEKV